MAKLDFSKLTAPVLELNMVDEANTTILVSTPSEGLVEELEAMLPNLSATFSPDNPQCIDAAYDLAARVISCNRQGLAVSADELRTKYWPKDRMINQLALLEFFNAYMEYIEEIKSGKN